MMTMEYFVNEKVLDNVKGEVFRVKAVALPKNLVDSQQETFVKAFRSAIHTRLYNNAMFTAKKAETLEERDKASAQARDFANVCTDIFAVFEDIADDDKRFIEVLVNIMFGFPKDGQKHFWDSVRLTEAVNKALLERRDGKEVTKTTFETVKAEAEAFANMRLHYDNAVTFKPFDVRFTKAQVNSLLEACGQKFSIDANGIYQKEANKNVCGKECLKAVLTKTFGCNLSAGIAH